MPFSQPWTIATDYALAAAGVGFALAMAWFIGPRHRVTGWCSRSDQCHLRPGGQGAIATYTSLDEIGSIASVPFDPPTATVIGPLEV